MNILLNDQQREKYAPTILELKRLCPEMFARKFEAANVQQAFTFERTLHYMKPGSEILCVGCFEDTAYEALVRMGKKVTGIDPEINDSLQSFFAKTKMKYDIIFSTSVIEHVQDDGQFLTQMCRLLKMGGVGILTCDFRDSYAPGDYKPGEDVRLYTKKDLLVRFKRILDKNGCEMEGGTDYDGDPDFCYGGCWYSFATFTFKKTR